MRQRLGQNFLVDQSVSEQIVMTAEPGPDDLVLEIGPGKGILTGIIAPLAKKLIAVELDPKLAAALKERYKDQPSVEIVHQDFLDYPFEALQGPVKIIANLPYYVSTAILEKILPHANWTVAVLMVQKEVGERVSGVPGTKEYGSFSLFCQYYAEARVALKVGPGCFFPPPKVDSVVLQLKNKLPPPVDNGLFPFIRLAFQQRRKTVLNVLSNTLHRAKAELLPAFQSAGVRPEARPEELRFEDFSALFAAINILPHGTTPQPR